MKIIQPSGYIKMLHMSIRLLHNHWFFIKKRGGIGWQSHWFLNATKSCSVFQWKIGDTFYIEKCSANEHTYLGFTRLLQHLERKWEQFCNLGSMSDNMNKKDTKKLTFDFQFVLPLVVLSGKLFCSVYQSPQTVVPRQTTTCVTGLRH